MTSKTYVGGLPFSTTDQELKGLFDEYGTVESARVIKDKLSGRSRGLRLCGNVQGAGSRNGHCRPEWYGTRRTLVAGQRGQASGASTR